jgi:hypothetical protein
VSDKLNRSISQSRPLERAPRIATTYVGEKKNTAGGFGWVAVFPPVVGRFAQEGEDHPAATSRTSILGGMRNGSRNYNTASIFDDF